MLFIKTLDDIKTYGDGLYTRDEILSLLDGCIVFAPDDGDIDMCFDSSQRLYSKGRVLGHKRGKRNTRPNTSLIQIEGVSSKEDAQFYLGKRIAYVYRAKKEVRGTKVRVIWGRVTRPHGNSGAVKSKFRSNLPPHCFGASVRVMLYPSNI